MALFLFTRAIVASEPIQVFNGGAMERDFTYIDDIVEAVIRTLDRVPSGDPQWSGDAPDPSSSKAPDRLYNIGNHRPENPLRLIGALESCLGKRRPRLCSRCSRATWLRPMRTSTT
jgi:UDP-glucuronate 4-epimerase